MITIYTDGACSKKSVYDTKGTGGWAWYNVNTKEGDCGNIPNTTNNRMELFAVIMALYDLTEPSIVSIVTDSQYVCKVVKAIHLKRTNALKNQDLISLLRELDKYHSLYARWVKAHNVDKFNNLVDAMARKAARSA